MKNFIFISSPLLIILFCTTIFSSNYNAYVNAKKGLLLREQPTRDSKIIFLIPYQSKVNVIEVTDKFENIEDISSHWVKINFNNIIGYAFGGFLKQIDTSEKTIIGNNNYLFALTTINKNKQYLTIDKPWIIFNKNTINNVSKKNFMVLYEFLGGNENYKHYKNKVFNTYDITMWKNCDALLYKNGTLAGNAKVDDEIEYSNDALYESNIPYLRGSLLSKDSTLEGLYIVSNYKTSNVKRNNDNKSLQELISKNKEFFSNEFFYKCNFFKNIEKASIKLLGDLNNDGFQEYLIEYSVDNKSLRFDNFFCVFNLKNNLISNIYFDKRSIDSETYIKYLDIFSFNNDGNWEIITVEGPYYAASMVIYKFDKKILKQIFSSLIAVTS